MSQIHFDLAHFRRKHDLGQTELAYELGVSISTVWRWENTGRPPKWFFRWSRQFATDRAGDLSRIDTLAIPGLDRSK